MLCALLFLCVNLSYSFQAILVAGSSRLANYRHQADLCHTYHLLVDELGIDSGNIKTLFVDDVAWLNPIPGKLFNEPGGPDVYRKCKLTSSDVSSSSFLSLIQQAVPKGNETLFISFIDHGSAGKLLFPLPGDSLGADRLLPALESLTQFTRVVVYVEACYAGSVFENRVLPSNVFVLTASNATESSWATFCPSLLYPDADMVGGVHIGTCLGDLFSVLWMFHLSGAPENASMRDHVDWVRKSVSPRSQVMMYGDESILNEKLFEIFPKKISVWSKFLHFFSYPSAGIVFDSLMGESSVSVSSFVTSRSNGSKTVVA